MIHKPFPVLNASQKYIYLQKSLWSPRYQRASLKLFSTLPSAKPSLFPPLGLG